MSDARAVCAFYSKGPHYLRMLPFLRKTYPQSRLVALVPPGYPVDAVEGLCDEVRTTTPDDLSALVRAIRAERFDVFVVMFHSPKLRMLSALSGAGERMCHTADNRFFPVSLNFVAGIGGWMVRNVRGRITYAKIWWIVHRQRVGK